MAEAWQQLAAEMVNRIRARGLIVSEAVDRALRGLPRHLFLPGLALERVYAGGVVALYAGVGQGEVRSSEPAIMAVMADMLRVAPGQSLLEVGTGSGYNAALLASLTGAAGRVTSLEIDPQVAEHAHACLQRAPCPEVTVIASDGGYGFAPEAPYDAIEITAACQDISPHWVGQLRPGGRLVAPVVVRGLPCLIGFARCGEELRSYAEESALFVPLGGAFRGAAAWTRITPRWLLWNEGGWSVDARLLADLLALTPIRLDGFLAGMGPAWDRFLLSILVDDPQTLVLADTVPPGGLAVGVVDPDARSLCLLSAGFERGRSAPTAWLYGPVDTAARLRPRLDHWRSGAAAAFHLRAVPRRPRWVQAAGGGNWYRFEACRTDG